ncbi:MAG TPA: energy transducer TonB [Verrucomicrobiae bacterium]|nr:energy transducer TonB [Verrucomicrobiae bacterium]
MNRLQKKCLIASTGAHAFLLAVLFIGPAFLSKPDDADNLPLLEFLPDKVVDDAMSGGGNPNVTERPAPAALPAPAPPVSAPPPVTPPPVAPPVEPPPQPQAKPAQAETPPEKVEPKKIVNDEPDIEPPKPVKPPKKQVEKPPVKTVTRAVETPAAKTRESPEKPQLVTKKIYPADLERKQTRLKAQEEAKHAEAEAAENARAAAKAIADARQRAVNGVLGKLNSGLSGGTSVEIPGPGGEAYANYAQYVKTVYDQAWIPPDDVTDNSLTVIAKVTIRRDGTVVSESTYIEKSSGSPSLDRSIKRTLERVKFVHPFPEGAKDDLRPYRINFNLKSKRFNG